MTILMKPKKKTLLQSMSELSAANYSQKSPEMAQIYDRLIAGRAQFEEVMSDVFDSLMRISSLDLSLNHYSQMLQQISDSVSEATTLIHTASGEAASVSETVSVQHEDLTHTIIDISEETSGVYQKIDEGQKALTETNDLSGKTILASKEMQQDMNQLSQIISQMNSVIARAGEAGKGFAVVADEIRKLADETQSLTASMGHFVSDIQTASAKSVKSADHTINSLETVTQKISYVWEINEHNRQHLERITNNISSLASLSEEISSSIIELESRAADIDNQCGVLEEDITKLREHGQDIDRISAPLSSIETTLDASAKVMGKMAEDAFYKLENKYFIEYIEKAINAHQNWLDTLGKILKEKTILPLQINDKKCGFGHFYYAINPTSPEVVKIWKSLGEKHKKFHSYGQQVIDALLAGNNQQAENIYKEACQYSKGLMQDLERIKKISV